MNSSPVRPIPGTGGGIGLPEDLRRVHMIGIGGAGMSGLARILLSRGGQVSGSDAKESRGVIALRTRGAKIAVGHSPSALDQLEGGPTVVVSTRAAIPPDNPELLEARRRGIRVIMRPILLAELMSGHRTLLVAGTHGKTSTTSMAVVALQHCGVDPSFAVGGELNESGTNAHHGSGDIFVAEADESDGSLLEYRPDVAVVTNVEADHLDFFGTPEAYKQVFDDFADRINPGGVLIVCLDDPGAAALGSRVSARLKARGVRVMGYGRGNCIALADGVDHVVRMLDWESRAAGGVMRVEVADAGSDFSGADAYVRERAVTLALPGEHMALNAIAAILGAACVGGPVGDVIEGIESFTGVHRRFQLRGECGGVAVYDDYAHHPSELRAVLTAARHMVDETNGRIIAIFQPHLYSRTAAFAEEFARALDLADRVIVLDVYPAREQPIAGVSGRSISSLVTKPVSFQPDVSALAKQVAAVARPGDLVLTLGAGDVTMQGNEIVEALRDAGGNVSGRLAAGGKSDG